VGVEPRSVLSDRIHITHVLVEAPQITFEGSPNNNNLKKILENVQALTGGAGGTTNQAATGSSKKIQLDDFVLRDAKVLVNSPLTLGQSLTVTLPEIHLTDIGKGPEGATPAEVTQKILQEVEVTTLAAVTKAASDLGKGATERVKDAGKAASALKGLLGK